MSQVLELNDTPKDIVLKMSEGNPGAMSVIGQLYMKNPDHFFGVCINLDAMDIRGPKIWLGYKDFCGQDLDKFIEKSLNRCPEMLELINKMMACYE